jgi:hypothetical protein
MCGGVYFEHEERDVRVYFPNPGARLPVRCRKGGVGLLPWGRRPQQAGQLPLGGWARLEAIYAGRWDRWFPVPVKLVLKSFMEPDIEGHARWYDLTRGQWIQGLVAREGSERRVYVVVGEPELAEAVHARWPRILSG